LNYKRIIISAIWLSLALATPAFAEDWGFPMIILIYPEMLLGLVPVILIEAFILYKNSNLTKKESIKISSFANCISTIAGIPLVWGLLVIVELIVMSLIFGTGGNYDTMLKFINNPFLKIIGVIITSPWLNNWENERWMASAACLILLIPFFFFSWSAELFIANIAKKFFHKASENLNKAMKKANFYGYLFFAGIVIVDSSFKFRMWRFFDDFFYFHIFKY